MAQSLHPTKAESFPLWQKKCVLSDEMRAETVQQCPDKFRLQFQALFRELFQCEDLSQLHLQAPGPVETMLPVIYHARIQAKLEKGARGLEKGNRAEGKRIIKAQKKNWHRNTTFQKFLTLYKQYVRECVYPQFSEYDTEVLYQAEPILRVVFPGSVASAKLHKDSEFWHQCNEVNYWVPLTDVKGENSLWSESVPGKGDFHSFDLLGSEGQLMRFYGNECMHYTVENTTAVTRVSFDFRVIPASLFTNVTQQHIASSLLTPKEDECGKKRKAPPATCSSEEVEVEVEERGSEGVSDKDMVKLWCGGKPRGAKPLLEGEYYLRMGPE